MQLELETLGFSGWGLGGFNKSYIANNDLIYYKGNKGVPAYCDGDVCYWWHDPWLGGTTWTWAWELKKLSFGGVLQWVVELNASFKDPLAVPPGSVTHWWTFRFGLAGAPAASSLPCPSDIFYDVSAVEFDQVLTATTTLPSGMDPADYASAKARVRFDPDHDCRVPA
jgi:hypothetical protein